MTSKVSVTFVDVETFEQLVWDSFEVTTADRLSYIADYCRVAWQPLAVSHLAHTIVVVEQ